MAKGNKGFGESLAEVVGLEDDGGRETPARGILQNRSDSLHRIATGKIVADRTEFVDPERCRPWAGHNRDLTYLTPESCDDLIESFKSAGRQRIPAIVRRLRDDPIHDFEIIAGVRRWWTVAWLRSNHHPEYDYLVTVQNLTDEEAFRVADLENRARKDISDIERARDYLRALSAFYDGSQAVMAERLNVSRSWMSRMLEVARLPPEILNSFGDPHIVTAKYASQIAPLIKSNTAKRDRVFAAAAEIERERAAGGGSLSGAATLKKLLKAAEETSKKRRSRPAEITSARGKPMLNYSVGSRRGAITIRILPNSSAEQGEIIAAVGRILDEELL